jgi:hypothetical protein
MLSKKCRRISAPITYLAIPVVIAVALTYSLRAMISGMGQYGAREASAVVD